MRTASTTARPKYLTKSRFKLGLECPTKLFFTGKSEYANQKSENEFLLALADGGYQVGELAKLYFPGGVDLSEERDHLIAAEKTKAELEKKNCIIYEAAFVFKSLYIRADIVEKIGNKIFLYEVKAKSWGEDDSILKDNKTETIINSKFAPYVYDVVFQKYVIKNATGMSVSCFLYLVNKEVVATVDGLNQKFKITEADGRKKVYVDPGLNSENCGSRILTSVPIDDAYDIVMSAGYTVPGFEPGFERLIWFLADQYEKNEFSCVTNGSKCGKCEFKALGNQSHLKCGFTECHVALFGKEALRQPLIYELWGGGDTKFKKKLIEEGIIHLHEIPEEKLKIPEENDTDCMHHAERKKIQIDLSRTGASEPKVLKAGLKKEMDGWKFPYHMIDFETSRVAIPFYSGHKPYAQIAFQFSHHIMYADGTYEHAGEWINTEAGVFPNFNFVRALKKQLEKDAGTVFRYSTHENTVLKDIRKQLSGSIEHDKDELISFIDTLIYTKNEKGKRIDGERVMVDLWEVLKRYFIHRDMKGSNSIKAVLPAMLNCSEYLKKKYSDPVYGANIKSFNFSSGKTWVQYDGNGKVLDPYLLLDPFSIAGVNSEVLEQCFGEGEDNSGEVIKDGGAAMMAYSALQFSETTEQKRRELTTALLKYCELDTLAMVMLVEGWREML